MNEGKISSYKNVVQDNNERMHEELPGAVRTYLEPTPGRQGNVKRRLVLPLKEIFWTKRDIFFYKYCKKTSTLPSDNIIRKIVKSLK